MPEPKRRPRAFEELDYGPTPIGELILRRRQVLSLDDTEVFEVALDGEFLMSSLVNDAELALATYALPLVPHDACDVLVGGLGLGYTAKAALDASNVASVTVIEYVDRVMDWHRRGLLPVSEELTTSARCTLLRGDFFATMAHPESGQSPPGNQSDTVNIGSRRYHAILVDIDHSPQSLLQPAHAAFYTLEGLTKLTERLHRDGVFALWSADPPDDAFVGHLKSVFASVDVRASEFYNPLLDIDDVNYIFIAQLA